MSVGVKPLDFAELCSNYSSSTTASCTRSRHSSYSSSSSCFDDVISIGGDDDTGYHGDDASYHGDEPGYHGDDVLYHAQYREELTPDYFSDGDETDGFYRNSKTFHSSSSISSDFQHDWLSVESVSTAISEIIDFDDRDEPIYENRSEGDDHTYQIVNKCSGESPYVNLRYPRSHSSNNQYENFKRPKEYENWKPKTYENFLRRNVSKLRRHSVSDHYQTPRPLSAMSFKSRYQSPRKTNFISTSSCSDLLNTPITSAKSRACASHLKSASLGFDPCARESMMPPPTYSESVENLKAMKESLQTVKPSLNRSASSQSILRQDLLHSNNSHDFNGTRHGIQRSSSTNFQNTRRGSAFQDYGTRPLERCSSQQISRHSGAMDGTFSDSKRLEMLETFSSQSPSISRSLQQLSKLLDERFMGHQIPSEESLCRLRFPSNAQSSNQNCDAVSRDESLANKSSGIESLANESSCCISSPGSCKPWEVETISLDSGVPLTSEDNECRTPEIVAQMYNQVDVLRVLDEERKRLQLIEDVGPYVGSLARRDKRRRPELKRDHFINKTKDSSPQPSKKKDSSSSSKQAVPDFLSKNGRGDHFSSVRGARDSAALSSSANSLESQGLKRSHTVCASAGGDIQAYLRSKCSRDIVSSRDDGISFKRHSKSTFDSGFESGLSDILDEILGGANYDPVLEENTSPKTKWQSFKGKLIEAFAKSKKVDITDCCSDTSEIKATKWDKLQQFVRVKVAKVSHQDLDMGGFEDTHWRTLEPRQFHRGTRKTQSFVKWNRGNHPAR